MTVERWKLRCESRNLLGYARESVERMDIDYAEIRAGLDRGELPERISGAQRPFLDQLEVL